jgi:ketosteroid isomerase-like protein
MGEYTRDEIEQAYAHYRATAAEAGASGDWDAWSNLFTEDAVYIEHLYGRFEGREAIRTWISTTMAEPLNREMTDFPADWWVIDEDRGWVVCAVWNRMQDIGDGQLHQAINWSLLKYAGDNQWSYEEDIYNVSEFADMIKGYLDAKKSS